MDLDDVRVFTRVVEAKSFTKAADLLGMPKSTVSRRVSDLEEQLGVRLLQRTTRKLSLTDAGEILYGRTARLIEEMKETERAIVELSSEPRGLLRITTPGDLSGTVPDLLREFQDRYPKVDVVVFSTGRRVDLVAEGYDLALRAGQLTDSSQVHRLLYRSWWSLFASPQYLEGKKPLTDPSELSSHDCLIFSNEHVEDTWTLRGPNGPVSVPVRGRVASRDFNLIRSAALRDCGIAYMPFFAGVELARRGRLVHLLPEFRSEESNLYAVYPSPRHLSPKVRVFLDFTLEWMRSNLLAV